MLASAGNTYFPLFCIRNCCRRTQSGGNYYRSMYLISHYKIYFYPPVKQGGNFVTDKAKAGLNFA